MSEVAEKVRKTTSAKVNAKANTGASSKVRASSKTTVRTKTAAKTKEAASQKTDTIDYNYIGSKEELAESRTITSRTRLRNKVEDDIAEFLARGGTINEIDADITADPPKKPENNYGSRAI
jgi:hypothetical protein